MLRTPWGNCCAATSDACWVATRNATLRGRHRPSGKLLHPAAVRAALKAYHDDRVRLRDDITRRRRELARRLARLKVEIEQLVDRICAGSDTPASNALLVALDGAGGERDQLEQELAALEDPDRMVDLHPGAIEAYTKAVADLRETSAAAAAHAAEAVEMLRSLVDRIEIQPTGRGRRLAEL